MTFLPIIERELRVRARGRVGFWLRLAVALAGLLICVQQLLVSGPLSTPAALGRRVFNEVVGAAFLLCCMACLLAADAISGERREGTLGLLFLTRVKSFDVLLGKLASVGLTSLCALLAFLPALMLPVLAGGLSANETCRETAALLSTLLFGLGAGLCVSAGHRERGKAFRAVVLLVALVVLVPAVSFVVAPRGLFHWLGWLSPLILVVSAGEPLYRTASREFWCSLVIVQALGWLLLARAGVRLRRAVQEETGAAMVRSQAEVEEEKRAVGLGHWEPAKEEAGPVEWLVYRRQGLGAGLWALAVLGLTSSRWMSLVLQPLGGRGTFSIWLLAWPLGLAGAVFGGAMVAFVASRFFAGVRRTGELELLLTTPLGADTVVSGQWKVLKRVFVWPVLLLQMATLVPALGWFMSLGSGVSSIFPAYSGAALLLNFVNTFLGAAALCWLGLWFGLKARAQTGAVVWGVTLAQGVPWLLKLLLGIVPLLPELATLLFYAWLIPKARAHLLSDLAGVEPMPLGRLAEFGFGGTEEVAVSG